MKLIVLVCLAAVALARPQEFSADPELEALRDRDRNAEITSYQNEQTQDGGNVHSFTATNGIERQEEIRLQEVRVINENGDEEFRLVPFYTGEFKDEAISALIEALESEESVLARAARRRRHRRKRWLEAGGGRRNCM